MLWKHKKWRECNFWWKKKGKYKNERFWWNVIPCFICFSLVDWCSNYCKSHGGDINPKAHRVFYSGCQVCDEFKFYLKYFEFPKFYLLITKCNLMWSSLLFIFLIDFSSRTFYFRSNCNFVDVILLQYRPLCMCFASVWDQCWVSLVSDHNLFLCP